MSERKKDFKTPEMLYEMSVFLAQRQKVLSYGTENYICFFHLLRGSSCGRALPIIEPSRVGTILSVRVQPMGVFKIVQVESFASQSSAQIRIFICKTAIL